MPKFGHPAKYWTFLIQEADFDDVLQQNVPVPVFVMSPATIALTLMFSVGLLVRPILGAVF